MKNLWSETHRPKTIDEYVFKDEAMKNQIKGWIADGAAPHLFFSGPAGTGKTTLAKLLLIALEVNPADVLEINASNENSVDTIRHKIVNFAETMPWGDMKYVLLDEADYLTPGAQAILRGVTQDYHRSCRFLLTCNYPNRVIEALHSRCVQLHISKLDVKDFTLRVATILIEEGVEFELDHLDTYVQLTYPDLRKCINVVQQNTLNSVLQAPSAENNTDGNDWMLKSIELFKENKYREARLLICEKARPEEYTEIFQFMYRNLGLWGDTDAKQDQAIVIIRKGLVNATLCADQEINLSATLIQLLQNKNS